MESLALMVVVIMLTSILGGPVAILLTYLPDRPKFIRVFRTIVVLILSLIGILFGYQLALGSSIPAFPRMIGFISVISSIAALLFEFKILKHKFKYELVENSQDDKNNETGGGV